MTAGSFRLRGHENQSDGLISALSDRAPVSIHMVPTPRTRRANTLWRALLGAGTRSPPNPDVLIGTGNATQLPVLVARRRRGGYEVVLMKTSFPVASFDLMIVPAHDRLAPREILLVTRGALNRARPAEEKSPGEGLILIGGPEREHPWAPDMHGGVGEVLAGGFPEGRVTAGDEDALLSKMRAFRSHPTRPATPVPFTLEAILAKTLALYAELAGGSPPYH